MNISLFLDRLRCMDGGRLGNDDCPLQVSMICLLHSRVPCLLLSSSWKIEGQETSPIDSWFCSSAEDIVRRSLMSVGTCVSSLGRVRSSFLFPFQSNYHLHHHHHHQHLNIDAPQPPSSERIVQRHFRASIDPSINPSNSSIHPFVLCCCSHCGGAEDQVTATIRAIRARRQTASPPPCLQIV